MKQSIRSLLALITLVSTAPAFASLQIFSCEPEWGALARELGGNDVTIFTATTARQDPHRIEARPSLIAQARRADLLICSGAGLESGWLPLLLRQSGNARIQPGNDGYLEAAELVERLDIPVSLDRTQGDLHAEGNPHVHLDPHRIALIATQLTDRLARLDSSNAKNYRERHAIFTQRWQQSIQKWEASAKPLRGVRAVTRHSDLRYLFAWLGMESAGTLEPKPGLPVTAGHLAELKQQLAAKPAQLIIYSAYQEPRDGEWLARQIGLPLVQLPYTVGGSEHASDLFALYDETIKRLLDALK